MKKKVIAAIDVGSHAIRMKIGELKTNGEFIELESFRKTAVIGHDTFLKGNIAYDSAERVCDILKNFKKSMETYNVTHYKAMATSAIREASNRDYILDQIRLKTGLNLEVINNSQEQFLTFKAVSSKIEQFDKLTKEGVAILVIGAGSIQITIFKESSFYSSQNVKMGALRIKEVLSEIASHALNYQEILEEYIRTNIEGLDLFEKDIQIKHLVAIGGEITTISDILFGASNKDVVNYIDKKAFEELHHKLFGMRIEEIIKKFNVKRSRAEVLLPSVILYKEFLGKSLANCLTVPFISFVDGIITSIYEDINHINAKEESVNDILMGVRNIGAKYGYNQEHSRYVEENCVLLFDKLKRLHGLNEDLVVLLQVAALLHEIGKFVSMHNHYLHAYQLIRVTEIFGFSEEHMELVALITRYQSVEVPSRKDEEYARLSEEERIIVSKLSAILRIVDALDISHKQKLNIINVKIEESQVTIRCESNGNDALEQWTFNTKGLFFEEVFGLKPVLSIKRQF